MSITVVFRITQPIQNIDYNLILIEDYNLVHKSKNTFNIIYDSWGSIGRYIKDFKSLYINIKKIKSYSLVYNKLMLLCENMDISSICIHLTM